MEEIKVAKGAFIIKWRRRINIMVANANDYFKNGPRHMESSNPTNEKSSYNDLTYALILNNP